MSQYSWMPSKNPNILSHAARRERRARIVAALQTGEDPKDIAAREQVSINTIKLCARNAGVPLRLGVNQLSATTYDILAGLLKGKSIGALAARFGVTKQHINRIADNARRAGIELPG